MVDTAKYTITDYMVVQSTTLSEVKTYVSQGWTIYGQPFYTVSSKLCQALVKIAEVQSQPATITYS